METVRDVFRLRKPQRRQVKGDIGALTRQKITLYKVIHIGKELNNLDETEVIGISDNDYVIYDNISEQKIIDNIRNLTNKQAKMI